MWQAISKLIGLFPALIAEFPLAWRRIIIAGGPVVVIAALTCFGLSWRLTGHVPPTALTSSLAVALDVKLLSFTAILIAVTLAWLAALVHSLHRRK